KIYCKCLPFNDHHNSQQSRIQVQFKQIILRTFGMCLPWFKGMGLLSANVQKKNKVQTLFKCTHGSNLFGPFSFDSTDKKTRRILFRRKRIEKMLLLVPSTLPRAPYGAAASTSSPTPLSIHPRPRR
uniref:Uncharacterized protein n=1 Tax=Aegilops tauschii subsp. strangulata TaxID=200361 RepID=A0A453AHB2_AEGTS